MKYFFTLGNNPQLSAAEILSALTTQDFAYKIIQADETTLILETEEEINAPAMINVLGGAIKIGEIINIIETKKQTEIIDSLAEKLSAKHESGKLLYGFSIYGQANVNTKVIGMELKNRLKEKDISCRMVVSRDKNLSSVVVEQNKLIQKGAEIVFVENHADRKSVYIGQTLAVQPFKDLSFRDFGRPARDDKSGMIPPKLAQIMINLSGVNRDATILDPFCGSGTIPMESILAGYNNVIGSDISGKANSDTKINLDWLKKNWQLTTVNCKLFQISATELSKKIPPESVDAIVTEPYLGPQRGFTEFDAVIKELNELYSQSIKEFRKILKPDGRVVMVWPIMRSKNQVKQLNPNIDGFEIIKPRIPYELETEKIKRQRAIIYGREGQKVWREIVILQKKS